MELHTCGYFGQPYMYIIIHTLFLSHSSQSKAEAQRLQRLYELVSTAMVCEVDYEVYV